MNAKVKATGKDIEVIEIPGTVVENPIFLMRYFVDFASNVYKETELEFPTPGKVVIDGYVARDKGGGVYLHSEYPKRGVMEWHSFGHTPRNLPKGSFPSITWLSEPCKVKIEITLSEEK